MVHVHEENMCVGCFETISNPVCEKCYTREIESWLGDLNNNLIPKKHVINKIKKEISSESQNKTKCIICGKEGISMCSYCFFLKTAKILKKLNIRHKFIKNFLDVFNYRQDHEEYLI